MRDSVIVNEVKNLAALDDAPFGLGVAEEPAACSARSFALLRVTRNGA
jgi:hypothetical protein